MKYSGTRYNSMWDSSTWLMLAFVVAVCIWPVFVDDWVLPVILAVAFLAIIVVGLLGIYYKIDGNNLVVYQFFIPRA